MIDPKSRRIRLISGDEMDGLSRRARRFSGGRSGGIAQQAKRSYNRRFRRGIKACLRGSRDDC